MDINAIDFRLFTDHSLGGSGVVNVDKTTADEDDRNTLFVNYAAVAWLEMRRAWRGDRSSASQRKPREPTRHLYVLTHIYSCNLRFCNAPQIQSCPHIGSCCSSTFKEGPFDGPVPLSKMEKFVVEMWE